jgi:hypothetical protein
MANVNRVNGFKPVGHLVTGTYNGQSRAYSVAATYATNLFVGDAVKLSGTADAQGRAEVEAAAAGDRVVGVIVGFDVIQPSGVTEHPGYHPASTAGVVHVCDDPLTIFEVQEDGDGGAAGVAAVGNTADHIVAAGSTTTGASGMEIDSSDVGTGSGWHILGFSQRADNEPANANAKMLVKVNEHAYMGVGLKA